MDNNYKKQLSQTSTFFFDVDGVFTDNTVLLMPDGEQIRTAYVRDGYAVQLAVKKGLRIAIISGGKSEGVRRRFEYLGVQDVFLGIGNKLQCFQQFILEHHIDPQTCCYMGDDIPDMDVMAHVGLAACPADAVPEIKKTAHYISPFNGGRGCVRDLLEQTLKIKGLWLDEESKFW